MLGRGGGGQLGVGEEILLRKDLIKLNVEGVKEVACGGMHTIALTNNGEVSIFITPSCSLV